MSNGLKITNGCKDHDVVARMVAFDLLGYDDRVAINDAIFPWCPICIRTLGRPHAVIKMQEPFLVYYERMISAREITDKVG